MDHQVKASCCCNDLVHLSRRKQRRVIQAHGCFGGGEGWDLPIHRPNRGRCWPTPGMGEAPTRTRRWRIRREHHKLRIAGGDVIARLLILLLHIARLKWNEISCRRGLSIPEAAEGDCGHQRFRFYLDMQMDLGVVEPESGDCLAGEPGAASRAQGRLWPVLKTWGSQWSQNRHGPGRALDRHRLCRVALAHGEKRNRTT